MPGFRFIVWVRVRGEILDTGGRTCFGLGCRMGHKFLLGFGVYFLLLKMEQGRKYVCSIMTVHTSHRPKLLVYPLRSPIVVPIACLVQPPLDYGSNGDFLGGEPL